jgi:hypothetical protein
MGTMDAATYFTTVGPKKGSILWKHRLGAIGVYPPPDSQSNRPYMPIGMAMGGAWDEKGRKTWRVFWKKGGELPGLWVVVDREFRRAR